MKVDALKLLEVLKTLNKPSSKENNVRHFVFWVWSIDMQEQKEIVLKANYNDDTWEIDL